MPNSGGIVWKRKNIAPIAAPSNQNNPSVSKVNKPLIGDKKINPIITP